MAFNLTVLAGICWVVAVTLLLRASAGDPGDRDRSSLGLQWTATVPQGWLLAIRAFIVLDPQAEPCGSACVLPLLVVLAAAFVWVAAMHADQQLWELQAAPWLGILSVVLTAASMKPLR